MSELLNVEGYKSKGTKGFMKLGNANNVVAAISIIWHPSAFVKYLILDNSLNNSHGPLTMDRFYWTALFI